MVMIMKSCICLTRFSEKDNKNNGVEQILKTIIPFFFCKSEICKSTYWMS